MPAYRHRSGDEPPALGKDPMTQSQNELQDMEPTLDDLDEVKGGIIGTTHKTDRAISVDADPSLSGNTAASAVFSRSREGYIEMVEMG